MDCVACGGELIDLTDLDAVGDHTFRCDGCGNEYVVTDVNAEASRLRLEKLWRELGTDDSQDAV